MDALKNFPHADRMLRTMEGNGVHIKTDIFNGIMYYAYEGNEKPPAPAHSGPGT